MDKLFQIINRGILIRRSCLYVALWLQIEVMLWAMEMAPMIDAGQIAAITGPMALLLGSMLRFYGEDRRNHDKDRPTGL